MVTLSGLISLVIGLYLYLVVVKNPTSDKMREIGETIQEGAMAYLKRLYQALAIVVTILGLTLFFSFWA